MNTTSIHLLISGKVQGVGFRWFIVEEAKQLGLAGWVRNLPTGEVEIAARGDNSSIQTFEELARKGPPGARVSHVGHLEPIDRTDLPDTFDIRR